MAGTTEVQALARELAAVKARLAQVEGALQLLLKQEPDVKESPVEKPGKRVKYVQEK